MATYKLGKEWPVKVDDILLVCKTSFTLDLSNEGILIQNDCTDDYGQQIEGGNKSGSFSGEFDYDFDSNGVSSMSWANLVPMLGGVHEVILGNDAEAGIYVAFDARLDNLSLTGSTNERISFSVTFNLSGAPEVITVT
jgi:hypothetical protein